MDIFQSETRHADKEQQLRQQLLLGMGGDSAAYHAFLQTLSQDLRGYFRRRLPDIPDEVEDLVQEVLLAIHNQRHTYLPNQPVTAWIYAIAKYKLIDRMRRRARRDWVQVPLDEDFSAAIATESDESAHFDVEQLLARLPDKQRLPIIYTKLEGFSIAETASRTGMSESSVKVAVHRGLKTLAKLIRGDL